MFEMTCNLDPSDIENALIEIREVVRMNGYISKKDLVDALCSAMPIHNEGDDRIGWGYQQIIVNGIHVTQNVEKRLTTICLDDPVKLTTLIGFDAVSRPSHYTEGRKYEPRKVIHDWGLNFNLGNAVKYISRAGRKGDAVEDLRKAIQYIEFEIGEMEENQNE